MQAVKKKVSHDVMGLISLILTGVVLFLVERPRPRYLHEPAWIFFLMAAVGLRRLLPEGKSYHPDHSTPEAP